MEDLFLHCSATHLATQQKPQRNVRPVTTNQSYARSKRSVSMIIVNAQFLSTTVEQMHKRSEIHF